MNKRNTKNIIFLDTETTGVEEDDRLVQVAYKVSNGDSGNELFKAKLPIKTESSAVCHITNKMVADKPKFKGSEMHSELVKLFAGKDTILVAHNAKFDIEMLKREGIEVKSHICTYKIAQYLDKEAMIPKYNLQYLRYFLDLDVGDVTTHDAMGDVVVLEKLFERLFKKMLVEKGDDQIQMMVDISKKPMEIKKFAFGKHEGKFIKEVAERDRSYLEWLLKEKMKEPIKDEDWIYTLSRYISPK